MKVNEIVLSRHGKDLPCRKLAISRDNTRIPISEQRVTFVAPRYRIRKFTCQFHNYTILQIIPVIKIPLPLTQRTPRITSSKFHAKISFSTPFFASAPDVRDFPRIPRDSEGRLPLHLSLLSKVRVAKTLGEHRLGKPNNSSMRGRIY